MVECDETLYTILQLTILCQKLDEIYKEYKSEILYNWYTFLREETLVALNMKNLKLERTMHNSTKKDTRAVFDPCKIGTMLEHLLNFNAEEDERIFRTMLISCPICLTEKMGIDCLKFICGEAFCNRCIQEYWSVLITEGNLDGVKCLGYKCNVTPSPTQVC